MKVTIEELKGINIEAYMDFLETEMQKIQFACEEIPSLENRLHKITINQFKWNIYFNSINPDANKERYKKYEKLSLKTMENIVDEINKLRDDLVESFNLASIENNQRLLKEEIKLHDEQKTEFEKDKEILGLQKQEPFTKEQFKELEKVLDAFMMNGINSKKPLNLKVAETINFCEIEANLFYFKKIFNSHLECDLSRFQRMQKIDNNAISTVLKEAESTEFKYLEFVQNATFCREFFYNMDVISEFAKIAYYSHVANEDIKPLSIITDKKQLTHPQKILLLEQLGFFKLETLNKLTHRKQEEITALLINEDETNTRKYINGLSSKEKAGNYNPYKNNNNKDVVNKLLS